MNADSKELRNTTQPEEAPQVQLKCCQRELKEYRTRVEEMEKRSQKAKDRGRPTSDDNRHVEFH